MSTVPPSQARDAGVVPPRATGTSRRTRLSPQREGELYDAVLQLLREVGYDGLTMDAVAARARSSKATLYRQWQSKPRLVAAALRRCHPFTLEQLDTGSLRGDLHELVRRIGASKKDIALVQAVAPSIHRDEDLKRALREALIQPELDFLTEVLRRAQGRGEIDPDGKAIEFLPHMLAGAVFARPAIEEREADTDYLRRYVDAVVLPVLLRN